MSLRHLDEIRHLKDASFHSGVESSAIYKLERDYGVELPSDHIAALQQSNGIEVYAGYARLFGVYSTESIDAIAWNHPDCWKFAWEGRCAGYWCFGETAWGDQYAYDIESLRSGTANVYFLEALSMAPQVVASSFTEFLEREFNRSAQAPYDAMIPLARGKLGSLELESHLVYLPSLLLGGTEDVGSVYKMNARAAMICNGDVATQLEAAPANRPVKSVQSYMDELHRMRLRLMWT